MDDKIPSANNTPPLQELSDTLRPAVEQIRAAAPPAEPMERALDRAQRLGPPPRRRSRRWMAYSAVAGIAAAILVCFWLWPNPHQTPSNEVARQHERTPKIQFNLMEDFDGDGELDKKVKDGTSNEIHFSPRKREDAGGDVRNLTEERARGSDRTSRSGRQPAKDALQDQAQVVEQLREEPYRERMKNTREGQNRSGPTNNSNADAPPSMGYDGRPVANRPSQPASDFGLPSRVEQRVSGAGSGEGAGRGLGMMGMGGGMMGMMGMGGGMGMNGGMMGMGGGMAGATDAKKALDITKKWQSEVKRLREEAERSVVAPQVVEEAEKELKRVQSYGDQLVKRLDENRKSPGAVPTESLKEIREKLHAAETRLQSLVERKPEKNQPQVWHRDRSRPTFARVYVGDGNALELVSLHVSVTIEGPRARTVVDHIFRNPHNRRLEGTFEYPLPTGASPSYFAMFLGQTRDTVPALFGRRGDAAPLPADALAQLTPEQLVKHVDTADWGRLQEGRIVSKEKALETYEEVVRGRVDPALLEYAGGNSFSGRVFPIPPKGYNRVILAYEELLPFAQEHMIYRFPLPGRKLNELQFNLQAKAAECLQPTVTIRGTGERGVSTPRCEERGGRLTFNRTWKDSQPEGEVLFACTPAHPEVQAVSGRQGDNGPRYVYARLRPALKATANGKAFASHAVFLLDTSLSEHPERFAVNMQLLRKILESDPDIKQFNILTFNVGAAWLKPKGFFENTAAGREKALKMLDGIVLEGATDISCALDKLAAPGFELAKKTPPLNVFLLSDGHITWGEPDAAALVARFEEQCLYPTRFHCYRTGLGEENSELFEALTRRGGGVFQCYGEAELDAAAKAHRSQCLRVERVRFVGGPQASDVLVSGRRAAVYPGGELVVAARFNGTGRTTVLVEGEFAGQKVVQEFPLEVRSDSELAPRAWAEVAVASLLSLHDSNFDALVTAYCQQFGIVSRVASFLVLENEADYKRFNLEEERGRTVASDLGEFIGNMWTQLGKRTSAAKAFERFLSQVDKRVHLLNGPESAHIKQLLTVLTEEDYALPAGSLRGGLVYGKDVAGYIEERERDRRNVGVYLTEARRRAEAGDTAGAVRVLSSIIEEYPSRGDALRLVGYRLLDLQQPAQAARLFSQVQKQRPFEPHSYRDLAHALEHSEHYGLAAINYEIVLAGTWHNRFRQELKLVAQEEYAHMMQEAIRRHHISSKLANLFGERLEQMARPQPRSDLRVTISWNTDATDVDLWVIEPDGTKCFYSHNRTESGGELSQDQTQGYGPERYQVAKAQPGVYTVLVHYFNVNPNLLGGESHVRVTVTRFAGTPQEKSEHHTVILKKHNQQVEVCKVKF